MKASELQLGRPLHYLKSKSKREELVQWCLCGQGHLHSSTSCYWEALGPVCTSLASPPTAVFTCWSSTTKGTFLAQGLSYLICQHSHPQISAWLVPYLLQTFFTQRRPPQWCLLWFSIWNVNPVETTEPLPLPYFSLQQSSPPSILNTSFIGLDYYLCCPLVYKLLDGTRFCSWCLQQQRVNKGMNHVPYSIHVLRAQYL